MFFKKQSNDCMASYGAKTLSLAFFFSADSEIFTHCNNKAVKA